MSGALLVTTSPEGLQPLGSAAQRSFELLTGTLKDRLGPDHAALLAEPVASVHGESIDWYAGSGDPAGRMTDLPEAERSALRETLAARVADIRNLAQQLSSSGTAEERRLAEALTNALEVPGEHMVWAVRAGDGELRPVLVHWAWIGGEQSAVRGVLTGMVPRRAGGRVAGAGGENAEARSAVWWWLTVLGWMLLAAMLAAILWLLIAPCGLRWSAAGRPVIVHCPPEPVAAPDVFSASRQLQDRISALRHELAVLDSACRPVVPVLPASPDAPPAAPDDGGGNAAEPDAAPAQTEEPAEDRGQAPDAQNPGAVEDALRRIEKRGGKTGALNFVLDWPTTDDLDLYVTCPSGETVSFQNRNACGGRYDLDANLTSAGALADPVENVVFEAPLPGIYKLRVNLRGPRSGGEVPLRLHVLRDGQEAKTYSGTLAPGQGDWTMNINISR